MLSQDWMACTWPCLAIVDRDWVSLHFTLLMTKMFTTISANQRNVAAIHRYSGSNNNPLTRLRPLSTRFPLAILEFFTAKVTQTLRKNQSSLRNGKRCIPIVKGRLTIYEMWRHCKILPCISGFAECSPGVQPNKSDSSVVYRGGVLNFELGTDVWPEVSTTTL